MTSLFGESRGGTPSGELSSKGDRAASDDAEDTDQRLMAFRFLILFRPLLLSSSLPGLTWQSMRRRGWFIHQSASIAAFQHGSPGQAR
jgi:hypothetical protein